MSYESPIQHEVGFFGVIRSIAWLRDRAPFVNHAPFYWCKTTLDIFPFEFSAHLFGGKPIPYALEDGLEEFSLKFLGCALAGLAGWLLSSLGLIDLVGVLAFIVGQLPADG